MPGLFGAGAKRRLVAGREKPLATPAQRGTLPDMTRSTLGLSHDLETYLTAHCPQHPVLAELAALTSTMEERNMQIGPNQASFMAWLLRTLGAKRCIEVGVFTGYSSLASALALPEDGYILACDVSEEYTSVARRHWQKAGVEKKIELVLGPAASTLRARLQLDEAETFDFCFIDADKESYRDYFELCLRLTKVGGVIAFDNMLWGGSVADPSNTKESTRIIRSLNDELLEDPRVFVSLVPVGDGMLLATKRGDFRHA